MKDIKRYFFINGIAHESDDGHWVRFDECENYIAARDYIINELEQKIKDLKSRLDFCMTMDKQNQQIIEQAEERIKELESDKHINEIKAQGICWALELASFDCTVHDDPVSVLEKVEKYAEQLRNNNEKND